MALRRYSFLAKQVVPKDLKGIVVLRLEPKVEAFPVVSPWTQGLTGRAAGIQAWSQEAHMVCTGFDRCLCCGNFSERKRGQEGGCKSCLASASSA
jgi:hypothetical protein